MEVAAPVEPPAPERPRALPQVVPALLTLAWLVLSFGLVALMLLQPSF